ncbi:hypothetical protein KBD59_02055 [Candidatus Gracilibacteria bacterium]|nr:hypothetical protein [Candidatus Gracilibacteria bacterium]
MKRNINHLSNTLVRKAWIAALLILILGTFTVSSAQNAPAAGAPEQAATAIRLDACKTQMTTFLQKKEIEFGTFVNEHFRSNQPTSELIPVAIEKFRRIRAEIRGELRAIYQVTGNVASGTELFGCQQLIDEHFVQMKDVLREHIISNAYAKKTTRLMDKYKRINDRLADMNFKIAQIYTYFSTFSQKLPCFATKCVKQ